MNCTWVTGDPKLERNTTVLGCEEKFAGGTNWIWANFSCPIVSTKSLFSKNKNKFNFFYWIFTLLLILSFQKKEEKYLSMLELSLKESKIDDDELQ